MTVRTQVPGGAPIWIDLSTSDQGASRAFYSGLFGWDAEDPDPELGGYLSFSLAGEPVAGCMPAMPDAPTDTWSVYLASLDAEQTASAALAAGGAVHAPAMDVRDLGRMAIVADPGAAVVGVWQPGTHPGLLTLAEPGRAGWFELATCDYPASLAFLTEVFGWRTESVSDAPGMRYSVASIDGEQVAGILDAPDAAPHWTVYFQVADADASAARVNELGGSVLESPVDTPFGRVGRFRDPTGAPFQLVA